MNQSQSLRPKEIDVSSNLGQYSWHGCPLAFDLKANFNWMCSLNSISNKFSDTQEEKGNCPLPPALQMEVALH
jgi:hypothetical protein